MRNEGPAYCILHFNPLTPTVSYLIHKSMLHVYLFLACLDACLSDFMCTQQHVNQIWLTEFEFGITLEELSVVGFECFEMAGVDEFESNCGESISIYYYIFY